jgi:hypothetical protein
VSLHKNIKCFTDQHITQCTDKKKCKKGVKIISEQSDTQAKKEKGMLTTKANKSVI